MSWQVNGRFDPSARVLPSGSSIAALALITVYVVTLVVAGPIKAAIAIALVCLLIGTVVSLELGVAIMLLSMLLSPEIAIAELSVRALTVRIEDGLIPLLMLAWLGRKALGMDRMTITHDKVLYAMAATLAIGITASLVGVRDGYVDSLSATFYLVKQLEFFGLFYFVLQYVHSEIRARRLVIVAVLTAVVIALYNFTIIPRNEVWTSHRISAPFEGSHPEPSSIGAYFVLIMAFLLALAMEVPNRRRRIGLFVLAGVVFVPFLFTLSRSSYVAFLVMLIALGILKRSRVIAVAMLIGFVASPVLLPQSVLDRVAYTFNDPVATASGFDRSFDERIAIWYKVWWSMRDAPFLGRGVTYQDVIDSYYARVLIETGFLGLVAFAFLVARLSWVAHRVARHHSLWWARAFGIGYLAALCGLLVHGLSAITFVIVRIMEPFWAVTGLLFGLYHQMLAATPDVTDHGVHETIHPEIPCTTSSAASAS